MPGFLVFFCLLTIFVVQLLCFHVPSPRFVCPMISTPIIILFPAEWIFVMSIPWVFMITTILNWGNNTNWQPFFPSLLYIRWWHSGQRCSRSQHWKWYSSYWTETKKKTLEVNYENRLGDISLQPFIHMMLWKNKLIIKSPGWGSRGTAVYEGSLRCGWHVAVKCFHKEPRYCSQSRNIHPSKITLTLSPIIIPNNPPIILILRSSCVRVHWLIFSKNCHGGGEKWDDIANETDTKRTMKQRASG